MTTQQTPTLQRRTDCGWCRETNPKIVAELVPIFEAGHSGPGHDGRGHPTYGYYGTLYRYC